jgi:hypothetical protein
MTRIKSRYRRFKDGGAVRLNGEWAGTLRPVAEDDPADDGISPQANPSKTESAELPREDADFLDAAEGYPHIMTAAVDEVRQRGIRDDSPEWYSEVKETFEDHIHRRLDESPAKPAPPPAAYEVPSRYRNGEPGYQPEMPSRSGLYSAPVSRDVPRDSRGERPGMVVLTPAMKEAAKFSGVSEELYAENLLKLRQAKDDGHYTGQP